MNLTDYHAKYYAYELTKRCSSDSLEKLAGAVASAQVACQWAGHSIQFPTRFSIVAETLVAVVTGKNRERGPLSQESPMLVRCVCTNRNSFSSSY